jgi:outer membrane autotransporter protein
MPLFYADMDTLVQRLGELRLLAQAPPPAPPTGISKEGGKEIVTPPPPVAPPSGGGVWFRGFGSGSHINDQVSRSFHQNLGGFQIGADKRQVRFPLCAIFPFDENDRLAGEQGYERAKPPSAEAR